MWAVFPHPPLPPPRPRWDVLWGRHKGTASHTVRASFPPRAGLRGRPRLPNIRFHPRAEGSVWLPGLAACHEILYCPTATHLSPSSVTLICNPPTPLPLCLPLSRGMDPSFPPFCVAEATTCNICRLSPLLKPAKSSNALTFSSFKFIFPFESVSSSKPLSGFTLSLPCPVSLSFFFFLFSYSVFAFMCSRGDPLERSLMSSGGTRQCDSLGFITHEDSGISFKV